LLLEQVVRSAAIFDRLPLPDRQWVAVEWAGKIVVSAALERAMQDIAEGWDRAGFFEPDGLAIYAPSARLERAVRGAAFREALDSSRAVTVPYDVPANLSDAVADESWFGSLAVPGNGGVIGLLTMSGAKGPGWIALRNPAALNLEISPDLLHTASLIHGGELNVHAIGLSRNDRVPTAFIRRCTGHDPDESAVVQALREQFEAGMRALDDRPESYRLLVYLEAPLDDPEIVIPTGTIFEQAGFTGVQTLAAAAPARVVVDPGAFAPLVLPSWCLNRYLSAPGGEPVKPTILRYMGKGSQDQVWDDLASRLADRP
jgi:hypothetical protein